MDTFDPQAYWEERLRNLSGYRGVGQHSLSASYNLWLYRVRGHVFLKRVRALQADLGAADVLDVGSGTGFYIQRWKELGVRSITGTDLTAIAVSRLQAEYPGDRFVQMDIGDPLPAAFVGRYDIVSAFDVLFHIVDDTRFERAIENIRAMLKPGGMFVFSDNFLHSPTQRGLHQVSRSLQAISDVLGRVGFNVVQRRPIFVLMNAPLDSSSLLWRLYWRALSILARNELLGRLLGSGLYPLELLLGSALGEGPSTEMMICQSETSNRDAVAHPEQPS